MLGIFNETGDPLVRLVSSSTCWKANFKIYDFSRDEFRKIVLDDARKNHFPTVCNLDKLVTFSKGGSPRKISKY